ncbi:acyl carrier protein [Streptomyces sp. NPDC059063]|uniref:acyl carrier protein n=1 Tax=unclassified Streptomyces TaxID=2593676 RepID=UPI003697EA32
MNGITERIATVLTEQFKIEREVIAADVTFGSLKFDSLVLIELGLILEKELDIAIEDGELSEGMTIRDAAQLLAAKGAVL